ATAKEPNPRDSLAHVPEERSQSGSALFHEGVRPANEEDNVMKKFLALAAAASALALAAPASAQVWQSINSRQANLDALTDAGVRDGSLTRGEAMRLRGEFNNLARLEARYRYSGGLSFSERMDLDRRFNALSSQIRYQRNDNQQRGGYGRGDRGWQPINARQ